MRLPITILLCAILVGCGAETASTAVGVATMKKQEIANGQKMLGEVQQKLNAAAQQTEQNEAKALDEEK